MLKSLTPKEMTNSELHVTELLNIYRHMKTKIVKIIVAFYHCIIQSIYNI